MEHITNVWWTETQAVTQATRPADERGDGAGHAKADNRILPLHILVAARNPL